MPGSASNLSALAVALSATATNSECALFSRISRELRDKSYHYALYEPEGLFYGIEESVLGRDEARFKLFTTNKAALEYYPIPSELHFNQTSASWADDNGDTWPEAEISEANQLRFVCRQMYAETIGLSIRCNTRLNFPARAFPI